MTATAALASFARPARAALTSPAAPSYVPGRCNIGREEIAARRRWGHLGSIASLAALGLLLVVGAPREARLVLFFPAAAAAVGYLQAWLRFCAAFGLLGIFNFGRPGDHERVVDRVALGQDRRRALAIVLASAAVGALAALAASLA